MKTALDTSIAHYNHILSLLATLALAKTLSCKRFAKAVNKKEAVPEALIANLNDAMVMCSSLSLDVPGSLQALAQKYVPTDAAPSK